MAKTISDEYKATIREHHGTAHDGTWGTTAVRNAGRQIGDIIEKNNPSIGSVLDYGCGRGVLKPWLNENYPAVRVDEYDPGIEGKDVLPEGKFALVVSNDVFEHVERDCIEAVIEEVFDKSTYGVFLHIATCLTGNTLPDGRDEHILVRNHMWWKSMLEREGWTLMEHSAHNRLQRGKYKTYSRFYFEKG